MILPIEIITDILTRLPAKSLLRFKIVCKLWYELITDPCFAKLHLERSLAIQSNLHFVFKTPVLHLADFDTFDNPIELDYPSKNQYSKYGGVSIIGSCHGLLCLKTLGFRHDLYIYNPTTQTHKCIPLLECSPYGHSDLIFDYGFGYDRVAEDYKLVRVKVDDIMNPFGNEVTVYSMKHDVWRTVPIVLPHCISHLGVSTYLGGNVYLNDSIHWVCYQDEDEVLPLPIVAFDLRDEIFSTLPLPNLDAMDMVDFFGMFVGILDGCLCLSISCDDAFHVWVMKDYGIAESWTKLFCVANHGLGGGPLCYSMKFDKLFMIVTVREIASMDLEKMDMTYVKVGGFDKCTDAHLCVENLLMLECRR